MTEDEQLAEEFAWVHQAYAAIPATEPEVLNQAIAAAMATVSSSTAHTPPGAAVTHVRQQARRMSWMRWSPWIALGVVCCIGIVLSTQWRQIIAERKPIDTTLQRDLLSATASRSTNHRRPGASTSARTPSTPQDTTPSTVVPAYPPTMAATDRNASLQAPDVAIPLHASRARAVDGLDPASATVMVSILDSAEARGLPIDGVVARIHEGVSRGIPPQRIVGVARSYVTSLNSAHASLGASATVDELRAGAEALQAGAPASALQQLRAARPSGSIVEPLIALADLSTHKVAPLQASSALSALVIRGGSDARVRALRTAVIADIIRGALPDAALAYRAHNNNLKPAGGATDSMPIPRRSP